MTNRVAYDRPVEAVLLVRLSNGEEWMAKPEDLAKFGYIDGSEAYLTWKKHVSGVLQAAEVLPTGDLTDAAINPLRHLVELVLCYSELNLLDHPETKGTDDDVVAMERILAALPGLLPGVKCPDLKGHDPHLFEQEHMLHGAGGEAWAWCNGTTGRF
jgi:hypothetical protein